MKITQRSRSLVYLLSDKDFVLKNRHHTLKSKLVDQLDMVGMFLLSIKKKCVIRLIRIILSGDRTVVKYIFSGGFNNPNIKSMKLETVYIIYFSL